MAVRRPIARSSRQDDAVSVAGVSWGWFIGLVLALLYGSLIPFDFDPTFLRRITDLNLARLFPRGVGLEDIAVNLLLYIPIGLAFVVCGRPSLRARVARIPVAIGIGFAISVLAETLQLAVVPRVASLIDVAVNTMGAAVGALLGAGLYGVVASLLSRLRKEWINRPFATGTLLLTVGLVMYALAPFDFVTSSEALQASFLRARWRLPGMASGGFTALGLIAELSAAFWFLALGYLGALAQREYGRDRAEALFLAIRDAVILIVLIEFLQLFTVSHGFDLADIAYRCAAAVIGAWSALFIVEITARPAWRRGPGLAAPTPLLVLLGGVQVIALLLVASPGALASGTAVHLSNVYWVPFEALWRQHSVVAANAILATLVVYGAIAGTLAMLLIRVGVPRCGLITCLSVSVLAVAVEGLHAMTTSGRGDVTTPILALLAACLTTRLYVTIRRVFRTAHGIPVGGR